MARRTPRAAICKSTNTPHAVRAHSQAGAVAPESCVAATTLGPGTGGAFGGGRAVTTRGPRVGGVLLVAVVAAACLVVIPRLAFADTGATAAPDGAPADS